MFPYLPHYLSHSLQKNEYGYQLQNQEMNVQNITLHHTLIFKLSAEYNLYLSVLTSTWVENPFYELTGEPVIEYSESVDFSVIL